MYFKFWSLVIFITTTIAVSTVQARCSFISDCAACFVSTYGYTREQNLWTLMCRSSGFITCFSLCSGLRSLNATVELLDLSHSFPFFDDCSYQPSCNIQSSDTPSVSEIDMSYAHVHDLSSLLNILKNSVLTLKLKYAIVHQSDTFSFSSYPMLKTVDLSGTYPASYYGGVPLAGAVYLETLYLDNNSLSEVPYEIRNMTSLKHLSLQHNLLNKTSLNKPDIFPLTLESLDLSQNNFRGSADFSWLNSVNLRTLRMQNTSIGNYHLPKKLGNMSNLEILDTSSSELPSYALDDIEMFLGLRVFNFSFNKLRGVTPAIQRSRLLRRLYLRSNDIGYVAPETFKNISSLTVLDLGGNKISSLPPIAFSGVEDSLEQLYLDGNQLETLDKCTILRLSRLRRLRIRGNPFHCDCKVAWLRSYRDKVVDNDVDKAFCNSPKEFKGIDVGDFSTEGCAPSQLTFGDCLRLISPTLHAVTETSPKHTVTETSPKQTDSVSGVDKPQQMTSPHGVTQVNGDEAQPLTSVHFSRKALTSACLAIGFSATCLSIIVVYVIFTGCRFYRRCRGKQCKATTKSERTMSGLQDTNCTEARETGPYQELESVSPYQNVAALNRPAENSYEALNIHTAI